MVGDQPGETLRGQGILERKHSKKIRIFGAEADVASEIALEPAHGVAVLHWPDDAEIALRVPLHSFFDSLVPELVLAVEVVDDQGVRHAGGLSYAARAGAFKAQQGEL